MKLSKHYMWTFILFLVCSCVPPVLAYMLYAQGKSPLVMILPEFMALWSCIQYFIRWRRTKENEHRYMLKLIQFGSNYSTKQRII